MQFQAPITISKALQRIEAGEYVIPVIQREFVWKTRQIERLFDSLMRDYPIGSFLFWEVTKETLSKHPFFEFSARVVQGGDNHRSPAVAKFDKTTAILDGQQRLTAFLVGLKGSYQPKRKTQPVEYLYVDLLFHNPEAGEEDLANGFRFMSTAAFDQLKDDTTSHWFRVGDVLGFADATAVHNYLAAAGIVAIDGVFSRLEKLRKSVREVEVINFYLETRDDLSEVLNVFVRLNRSGTTLSYPDLLLSAATVGWKSHNAPKEFKSCVASMNAFGFEFTRERVLKAGLVLADLGDIKFKAENFKSANALQIEKDWLSIKASLVLAAELLKSFGLSHETLPAQNVIIPVAYYLRKSQRDKKYLTSVPMMTDREAVRQFVVLSLVKSGFWTGAVDQVLLAAQDVLKSHGTKRFPLKELEKRFSGMGKSLKLSDADIDGLLRSKYRKRGTGLVLSLLYAVDWSNPHHQDHVVPRSRLTEAKLKRLKIPASEIALILDRRDRLPNLQLLQGHVNVQKSKMPLAEFVGKIEPVGQRQHFLSANLISQVPLDETEFTSYYEAREAEMRAKLAKLLA
jgi:hypothetical protein